MPRHFILWLLAALVCLGLAPDKPATLDIYFEHMAGKLPLVLDSQVYMNSLQQDFRVSKFRYYIGAIQLVRANGKKSVAGGYYLVDEAIPSSKSIRLEKLVPGHYTAMEFMLGVDSLNNCSGAQSGALDPVHGMFWAWNTGYIFLKLEGTSSFSKSPLHMFEYHIGGYRQPTNCIRKIRLTFPDTLLLSPAGNTKIRVQANVLAVLQEQNQIDFSAISSVTDHRNAMMVADNYARMFRLAE